MCKQSMACRLGQAAALNHITAHKKREDTGRRERAQQKNEMKELQMRDFPVRRINQPTMKSIAQSPRLWTGYWIVYTQSLLLLNKSCKEKHAAPCLKQAEKTVHGSSEFSISECWPQTLQ